MTAFPSIDLSKTSIPHLPWRRAPSIDLSVDTTAMQALAERIRQAVKVGVEKDDRRSLQPAISALGTPALAHAASTFIERWSLAVSDLADEAHRLADAIDLTARAYQDLESMTERAVPW
jgi:hypothetical protein